MDRLVKTRKEQFWHPEAYARDQWVKVQAGRLRAGSKVLDVGAGASKYRPVFSHCEYKTQDFCAYQGELVQYVEPIDYVCDLNKIPLSEASLDCILCTEVFEHVVDPMRALTEFTRLVRPGGKLLLTAPLISALHMEPYHFYGGFTHFWYRHWLPERGFEIDSITPVGGPARTCVTYASVFLSEWSRAERTSPGMRKLLSRPFRYAAKLLIHGLLPRILPRLDSWIGSQTVCSGYMVEATRCDANVKRLLP